MSQYSTDASTVAVGSPGEGGGTTEQVKDQVREKAAVAQDKARGALGQARGVHHHRGAVLRELRRNLLELGAPQAQ